LDLATKSCNYGWKHWSHQGIHYSKRGRSRKCILISCNNGDEAEVTIHLLKIVSTFQAIPTRAPTTSISPFKPFTCFHVEMPLSPLTPTNNQQDELVVSLEDSNLELDDLTVSSQTQVVTKLGDLLCLPRLPKKKKHGKEPLVDYSSSHVVTSNQYLVVLRQKAFEKKLLIKLGSKTQKKDRKRNQKGLNIHLPQRREQFKGMLKKK